MGEVSKASVCRWRPLVGSLALVVIVMAAACGRSVRSAPVMEGNGEAGAPSGSASGGTTGEGGESGGLGVSGGSASGGGSGSGASPSGGVSGGGGASASGGVSEAGAGSGGEAQQGRWFRRGVARFSTYLLDRTLASLLGAEPSVDLERAQFSAFAPCESNPFALLDFDLGARGAEAVASLSDEQVLRLFGCDGTDESCVEAAIPRIGLKVWRRPLEGQDVTDLLFVSRLGAGGAHGMREVLGALFSSAEAYVLSEAGTLADDGSYRLTDFEMASVLAYTLTRLPPDDGLLEAAANGELKDPVVRGAHAERLLQTPDGALTVEHFVRDWFGIRDPDELWLEPAERPLADAMLAETRRLIDDLVFARDAPLVELLTAEHTFVDGVLAAHYGMEIDGSLAERVDLGDTPRRGLLHHASWLTSTASGLDPSYSRRGSAVLRLLCVEVPVSPPDANQPAVTQPGMTRRQSHMQAVSAQVCAGCHALLDPPAFAFEHFDGTGVYRELENGLPIDASGTLELPHGEATFASSTELVAAMAEGSTFAECYARNLSGKSVGAGAADEAAIDYASSWSRATPSPTILGAIHAWVESRHFELRSE